MSYVGLDLATRTGWATWWPGIVRPHSGTLKLSRHDPHSVAPDLEKLRAHLSELHKIHPVELVFYEAPIMMRVDNIDKLRLLLGLANMVEWWCHKMGIPCRQAAMQDWRKHFLGFHQGGRDVLKAAAVKACADRGWETKTDDQAEALGVLDYGLACWKIDVPWRDVNLMRGAA
mgnify:CR=1 FL=1